jgi:RNase P/RNase MRP subunit p29
MMDTKTLVVGEYVQLESGCYGRVGRVVKVTPDGVEVQTTEGESYTIDKKESKVTVHKTGEIWRFDKEGKGGDGEATRECGPWYITERW